jgi:hypothetical protein
LTTSRLHNHWAPWRSGDGGALRGAGRGTAAGRHRVVVAVLHESVPNSLFGHVRSLTAEDLTDLGALRLEFDVYYHHGGWLVLDRTHAPLRPSARTAARQNENSSPEGDSP